MSKSPPPVWPIYKRLLGYTRRYWPFLTAALIAMVVEAAAGGAFVNLMEKLTNSFVTPTPEMALILPTEAQANSRVWGWLEEHVAGNGPIRRLVPVDVRQSMANGGGPACLRLRVVADPTTVDQRFIADEAKLDRMAAVIAAHWPESIAPDQLGDPALVKQVQDARLALLKACDLSGLA